MLPASLHATKFPRREPFASFTAHLLTDSLSSQLINQLIN